MEELKPGQEHEKALQGFKELRDNHTRMGHLWEIHTATRYERYEMGVSLVRMCICGVYIETSAEELKSEKKEEKEKV